MGILDILLGKKELEDVFFGKLRVVKLKKEGKYNKCKRFFFPVSSDVEFLLKLGGEETLSKQKLFFEKIEMKYEVITSKIKPILQKEVKKIDEDIIVTDLEEEFDILFIKIPTLDVKPVEWQISYKKKADINNTFHFKLKDYNIDSYEVKEK